MITEAIDALVSNKIQAVDYHTAYALGVKKQPKSFKEAWRLIKLQRFIPKK